MHTFKKGKCLWLKGPLTHSLCEKYSENVSAIVSAEMCYIPRADMVSIHRRVCAFSQTTFLGKFLFLKTAYKSFSALRSNPLICYILPSLKLFSGNKSLLQFSLWNHFWTVNPTILLWLLFLSLFRNTSCNNPWIFRDSVQKKSYFSDPATDTEQPIQVPKKTNTKKVKINLSEIVTSYTAMVPKAV